MLNNINGGPLTFLRYGLPRTKDLLKDIKRIYDGIVVPANILLYQYKSTPAIIYNLRQPFFIDPMTYLFAHPFESFRKRIEKGRTFKPSFEKLLNGYGLDADSFTNNHHKLIDYLKESDTNIEAFVTKGLDFQWNMVERTILDAKDLVGDIDTAFLKPAFIIPPYFLYKRNDEDSELNYKMLDVCMTPNAIWGNANIFPMLFIGKDSLINSYTDDILERHTKYDFPGYCIWVDDFDERYCTEAEITGLVNLIRKLSSQGKQVIMLYGGFFSMLLNKHGLTGVCHGLAYSESKAIGAAINSNSGPAPVRYYVPDLHQFLSLPNSLIVLKKRPDLICDCPICQRIIQNNPDNVIRFEAEETLSILHFLYRRYQEKEMIAKLDNEEIIKYLQYISDINSDIQSISKAKVNTPIIDAQCLGKWKNALEAFIGQTNA